MRTYPHGKVYFLRPIGMAGPIKIGHSCWPDDRLTALQHWSPFKLELVASARAKRSAETRLHYHFRLSWSHQEWFEASPELIELLNFVKSTGLLPKQFTTGKPPINWRNKAGMRKSYKSANGALYKRLAERARNEFRAALQAKG